MPERVSIYIDGGNFHHLVLKKLGTQELNFDFNAFANHLIGSRPVANQGKRYYVGTVREIVGDARSKQAMARQTKFFTILQSYGWRLMTSKLRSRQETIVIDDRVVDYRKLLKNGIKQIQLTRTREKGIDVKLAIDLMVGAIDDKYDTAIIVSSDTDLIPAIDWIRNRCKKKVEYIGFSLEDLTDPVNNIKPIPTFIMRTDLQRIFIKEDLLLFIQPFTQNKLFNS